MSKDGAATPAKKEGPAYPIGPERGWRFLRLLGPFAFVLLLGGGAAVAALIVLGYLRPGGERAPGGEREAEIESLRKALEERDTRITAAAGKADDALAKLANYAAKGDLEEIQGRLKGLVTTAALQKAIKDAVKASSGGEPPDLTEVKKQIEALEKRFGKDGKLIELRQALQRLDEKFLPKAVGEQLKKERDEAKKAADDAKKATDAAVALEKQTKAALVKEKQNSAALAKRAVKAEPVDVLIVGLHSNVLSLHKHKEAIRDLIDPDRPLRKSKILPPECRVAFARRTGDEALQVVAPFDLEGAKLDDAFRDIRPVTDKSTDNLADVKDQVRRLFKDKGRPGVQQKCIILTSTACVPPRMAELAGWKGLEVDVVLIGSAEQHRAFKEDQRQRWDEFAAACGGLVIPISTTGDPSLADKTLQDQVRRCLWQSICGPLYRR